MRIVGRYVPKTEAQRSWDIRGFNDRLNRVFELNRLLYGGYPGQDVVDRRGKKPAAEAEDDSAPAAAPSSKKRKLGTAKGGLGVSDSFSMELMGTCAAPGGRMSSPELRESSARMLKVTGGWWPKNVPIPRAAGEDFFTSRMVRDLRLRRSVGRSSGCPRLGRRGRGGLRSLPPPAVASRRWRRSWPPLGPARCRRS
jgi:hypothetical protein